MLIHHLIWIRTGSGDCSDLGIRKKQTNISVDVKTIIIIVVSIIIIRLVILCM